MWTVKECERCLGGGMLYCPNCEMPCEHDQLCNVCKGYNWLPVKVTNPFELLALTSDTYIWGPWRTRRQAFATIEYYSLA